MTITNSFRRVGVFAELSPASPNGNMELPVELVIPILKHASLSNKGDAARSLHAASLVSRTWAAAARDLLYGRLAVPEDPVGAAFRTETIEITLEARHGASRPGVLARLQASSKGLVRLHRLVRTLMEWRAKASNENIPSVRHLDLSACHALSAGPASAATFITLAAELLHLLDLGKLESVVFPFYPINNSPLPGDIEPRRFIEHVFESLDNLASVDFGSQVASQQMDETGLFAALAPFALATLAKVSSNASEAPKTAPKLRQILSLATTTPGAARGAPSRTLLKPVDLRAFASLDTLEILHGSVTDALFFEIASACKKLRRLRITSSNCSVTAVGIDALCDACQELEVLRVAGASGGWWTTAGAHAIVGSKVASSLACLDFGGEQTARRQPTLFYGHQHRSTLEIHALELLSQLTNLTILSLADQEYVDAVVLPPVLASLHNLQALCLRNCKSLFGTANRPGMGMHLLPPADEQEDFAHVVLAALPRKLKVLDLGLDAVHPSRLPMVGLGTPSFGPFGGFGLPSPDALNLALVLSSTCPDLKFVDPSLLIDTLFDTSARSMVSMGSGLRTGAADPLVEAVSRHRQVDRDRGAFIQGLAIKLSPTATIYLNPKFGSVAVESARVLLRKRGIPGFDDLCIDAGFGRYFERSI